MNLPFFLVSFALGGFIISAANAYLFILTAIKLRNQLLKKLIHIFKEQNFFPELIESFHLQQQVEELADEKLDHLVANFKIKVPMVGMFLAGELEATLKSLAKEELLSMVPEIEKNVMSQVHKNSFYENIEKQLSRFSLKSFFPFFIRMQLPALIMGTLLGAIFGAIFYFFFRP